MCGKEVSGTLLHPGCKPAAVSARVLARWPIKSHRRRRGRAPRPRARSRALRRPARRRRDDDGTYVVQMQSTEHAGAPAAAPGCCAWFAPVRCRVDYSGYTLAPLQAQFSGGGGSQETLVTHVLKVAARTPPRAAQGSANPNRDPGPNPTLPCPVISVRHALPVSQRPVLVSGRCSPLDRLVLAAGHRPACHRGRPCCRGAGPSAAAAARRPAGGGAAPAARRPGLSAAAGARAGGHARLAGQPCGGARAGARAAGLERRVARAHCADRAPGQRAARPGRPRPAAAVLQPSRAPSGALRAPLLPASATPRSAICETPPQRPRLRPPRSATCEPEG